MEPPNQSGRKNTMERSLRNGDFLFNFSLLFLLLLLCFVFPRTPKNRTKDTAFLFCVSFICADTHSIALGRRIVFVANVSVIGVYGQKKEKSEPHFRKGHVCHQQIGDVWVYLCVCVSPFVSATTTTATNPYQCALALYVRVWLL